MTDLPNRVYKQQLHFVAIIVFITLENFTLRTFEPFSPEATGRLLLARLYLFTWKKSSIMQQYQNKQTRSIGTG